MKKLFAPLIATLFTNLVAAEDAKEKYFSYLREHPQALGEYGDHTKGEIEIIVDEEKILEIEALTGWKVGVIAEDMHWIWLNDAAQFPNGSYGVYKRLVWRKTLTDIPGTAIIPILPNGKIALNCNYRHATRSWEYELPRGGIEQGEAPEHAALREMKEETGYIADKAHLLGVMHPDTGMTNGKVFIFSAKISYRGSMETEDSEAIESIDSFSIDEIKQGFLDGFLTKEFHGKVRQVSLKDPFLAFALFQLEIRKKI